jgi:uncharacterized protein (TIGR00730 family)
VVGRLIKSVCIFCGSNFGSGDLYRTAAVAMGRELALRGIKLTFGGTHKGLMGVLADAALDAGGTVHGVITQRLFDRGHLHPRLTTREIVLDMRSRKARMLELADVCIALPGGIGTVEEFMEAWTLNQLGDIDKPVGLLDVDQFFQPLLTFIDSMIARKFLPSAHRQTVAVAEQPGALLDALATQDVVTTSKWIS